MVQNLHPSQLAFCSAHRMRPYQVKYGGELLYVMFMQVPKINPGSTVNRRKQAESEIAQANLRLYKRLHAIKSSPEIARAKPAKQIQVSEAKHKKAVQARMVKLPAEAMSEGGAELHHEIHDEAPAISL